MLSGRLFVIGSCPAHWRVVPASLADAQISIYDNQNCPLSFPDAPSHTENHWSKGTEERIQGSLQYKKSDCRIPDRVAII